MPKVSALMPAYNTQEDHLRGCIDSILAQTFTDFELIILNDCSTDENVERVVKSYDDPRIVYYRNERNLGISDSRNRLIDLSRGEYLAVIDHDDQSVPERFAEQVAWLDAHPETGIVSGFIDSVNDEGKHNIREMPETNAEITSTMFIRYSLWHPACMMRKSVLVENNVRYEALFSPSEDYALFCRLVGKTQFHNIQKVHLIYRYHSNNTSHHKAREMNDAEIAIRQFVREDNPDLWRFKRQYSFKKHRVRLFGFLPILKIEEDDEKIDVFLFSFLKILRIEKGDWRER